MFEIDFQTSLTLLLFLVASNLAFVVLFISTQRKKAKIQNYDVSIQFPNGTKEKNNKDVKINFFPNPPGPKPFPIIGSMHLLGKYSENPYEGFTDLAQEYGPVYRLKIGSNNCVIVSSFEAIMEVLLKKGNSFDSRPNFKRWSTYFDGNRQHSLALCDWSDIQKTRRNVVRAHLMMKRENFRNNFEECAQFEIQHLIKEIDKSNDGVVTAKIPIGRFAMNVFMNYMCTTRFDYDDTEFQNITECFDKIFEDINNGHPTDVLPWLSIVFKKYESNIQHQAETIRSFILRKIIKDRLKNFDGSTIEDLLDALLANYLSKESGKLNLDWTNILFALEDLLGGSCAVSNMTMIVLTYLAQNVESQKICHEEIDRFLGPHNLPAQNDRATLLFVEAAILESLRLTSSPIVPHVANEDATIGGYFIPKESIMIINNHELNTSPKFWDNPMEFKPQRFISGGQIKKPSYFIPFSTGKRACIGSQILKNLTFLTVTAILQKYHISIPKNVVPNIPTGKLALVGDGFPLQFSNR